ncbi:MAG: DUF433 domain-containing protein [Cyanobacteria bacterium P01_H01_bin.21]
MSSSLLERITIDPDMCHGKPCIRGLRYPVKFLLELLSSGITHDEILADYDDLGDVKKQFHGLKSIIFSLTSPYPIPHQYL